MPRSARLAVLFSASLHGILILAARYRLSYDAYVHMFFGDHYRMDWWSLWDPRWYTGFSVTSYPPLVHQLIGAFSHILGIDAAFALILWIVLTILPLSLYSFARVFVGKTSAGYAALGAAFLPSVFLTAHIFGQLPTLAGTVTALFAMAALDQFLRNGRILDGALSVSLLSTVMAFHHATLLLLPWLAIAITAQLISIKAVHWQTLAKRLLIVGVLSAFAMLLVIWPFWQWGRTQSMQTPIDHLSRHNFFKDPVAPLLFFLPVYGPLAVIIPAALSLARNRRLLGLGLAFFILFLLGLGDTTPLPHLFFGKGWQWLTYDRFAFWASLLLLPFFGMIIVLLRRRRSKSIRTKVFLTLAVSSLIVGLGTVFLPLQPGAVNMAQIVSFLKQGDHARWRYVTFGFGDQLAFLSTLTTATTIDGSYHTARTLPELRTSGVGQIDSAFWLPNGLLSLEPILRKAGEHGVRWGFVNIPQYIPVLERNGWQKINTLRGGVQVWENPNARLPSSLPPQPASDLASFSWGTLPILSLATSISLGSLRVWDIQAEKALKGIYAFSIAFIPLGLTFWYYKTIHTFPHDRVYFTYTDALFYLSDALMLLAVILWLSSKLAHLPNLPTTNLPIPNLLITYSLFLPLSFCLLCFFSILWSRDWRTSLYVSVHVVLVFLLILSLQDWNFAWRPLLLGFCAALSLQFLTGMVEFATQTTAFLKPLEMKWPGLLNPSVRGASIVQLPGGDTFLRAYGTFPHPNLLGGFLILIFLGPIAFFLRLAKPNDLALLLLVPGISLLALTFSRSAWLALVAFCSILLWKAKYFDRKRLALVIAVIAISFVFTLLPYRKLVQARTTNTTSHAEEFSFIGRAWLNGEALNMIREYPLTGVGIGSFILELARRAGEGYVIEPVHNVFLLAGAELGIPGLLLVIALFLSIAYRFFKAQNPNAILAGATLTGLGVICLFDHYLWTLAPGRLMLGLAAGLFLGQDMSQDA